MAGHPSLSPSTRNLYRVVLDNHVIPQLGDARLVDIEPATVERWFHGLTKTTTLNQRAKSYRLLRGILNHAVKNQRIIRNPCLIDGGGKESSPERPVATIPQVFALAAAFPDRLAAIVSGPSWPLGAHRHPDGETRLGHGEVTAGRYPWGAMTVSIAT